MQPFDDGLLRAGYAQFNSCWPPKVGAPKTFPWGLSTMSSGTPSPSSGMMSGYPTTGTTCSSSGASYPYSSSTNAASPSSYLYREQYSNSLASLRIKAKEHSGTVPGGSCFSPGTGLSSSMSSSGSGSLSSGLGSGLGTGLTGGLSGGMMSFDYSQSGYANCQYAPTNDTTVMT